MSKPTKPIRVLLVDDHVLFRDGIASLLARDKGFEVVGETGDGEAAFEAVNRLQPDVVLMDIRMPGMGGLEATRRLIAAQPTLKVIMLTISDKDEDLFEAVKAGAQGYILKTATAGHDMREAIRRVAAGEAIIPAGMVPRLLAEFAFLAKQGQENERAEEAGPPVQSGATARAAPKAKPQIQLLTPREREVLELVADGLTNKEIALYLVISENTVRAHLRSLLDKLHVSSRVQAAVWLRQHHLD
ncbi:MAG: response regulator transcription factor [Chloroflexota bacterium]